MQPKTLVLNSNIILGQTIAEKDKCKVCLGRKTTKETKILEVTVSPGMSHNQKITFRGEGDQEVCLESLIIYVTSKVTSSLFAARCGHRRRDHSFAAKGAREIPSPTG